MSKSIDDPTASESATLPSTTRFGRVSSPEFLDFKNLLAATKAPKKPTEDSTNTEKPNRLKK